MITKTCTCCRETLPATKEFFRVAKKGLYGLRSQCNECEKRKVRRRYQTDETYRKHRLQLSKDYRRKTGFDLKAAFTPEEWAEYLKKQSVYRRTSERSKKNARDFANSETERLTDNYIKRCLMQHFRRAGIEVTRDDFTPELIELQRKKVQLYRIVNNNNDGKENNQNLRSP